MEKQYIVLKNDQAQSGLKKGMKGYIHSYVHGADNRPYAVVVSDKVIDLVALYNLEPCENFTDNLPQCLKEDTETAFAIPVVSVSCEHSYDLYENNHGEKVMVCSKCMDAYF